MINSIKDLDFDEIMTNFIKRVEEVFDKVAEEEESEETMLEWINDNINFVVEDGILIDLTDREKFMFAFGILISELEQKFNG